MEKYSIKSAEHFVNIIRFIRNKRGQSTYLTPAHIEVLNELFTNNSEICSEYISFTKAERTNTKVTIKHLVNFLELLKGEIEE